MRKTLVFIFLFFSLGTVFAQRYPKVSVASKDTSTVKQKPKKEFLEYYIGDYKFKERNNYLSFGFGPSFYPQFDGINNANLSVDFHYFDKLDRQWLLGYQAHYQNYLLSGGPFVYLNSIKFGRALYRKEAQYFKWVTYAVPNVLFTNYYPTDTVKTLSGKYSIGVGLQIQTEFFFKPVYDFGVGVSPFVNLNTIQTVAGLTFTIYGSNAMSKKMR